MQLAITRHAQARMQQRGIRLEALSALLEFGRAVYDKQGGRIVYFDKAARKRLNSSPDKGHLPGADQIGRVYAVVSVKGEVVTVGHRYKRLNRS